VRRKAPVPGVIGCAFALVLTLAAGCASYSPPGSSPYIVKKGSGPINVGHGTKVTRVKRTDIERASRDAIAKRSATSKPEGAPSIERLDPVLREALASLERQGSAKAHVAVGQQYWRLRVYDAAYDHFSDAIRLEPRNVAAWEGRARVWRDWHLPGPALSDVYRARFYGPDRPEVLNTLGTILEQAGQCGAAQDSYASAVKLDPTAAWAKANLVRLQDRSDTCEGPGNTPRY
jgi:tetratricopeptide (TPR) repeat protein